MDVATMKKDLENQIGDISKELENIYLPLDAVLILQGKRTAFRIALELIGSLQQEQPEVNLEEELVALKNAGGILRDYGHSELAKKVFMIEGKLANLAVLNKSTWKPSEEQIDALERCAEYLEESDNEDADILAGLYEHLKKLM